MKGASHIYWLLWFVVGFGIPEYIGLRSAEFATLSATFKWLRDCLPWWGGILVSAGVAAVLFWLLSVHWIFSGVDRPGFDKFERFAIIVGVVLGAIGAVISHRKKR